MNKFVNSYSWLGSRATAESYANSDWGQENGYQVVEFGVVKDLKLFKLNVYDNIQYLWDGRLTAEIAVFKARDTVAINQIAP